jgi:hypothetical protein
LYYDLLQTEDDYSPGHLIPPLMSPGVRVSLIFTIYTTEDDYSPRHLIPPLMSPGVRVSLIFTVLWIVLFTWFGHWFWLRISSVYLIWRADSFRLPNLDTDFDKWFWGLQWDSRRVRPVNRECLLLLDTWSHLWFVRGSVLAHLFTLLVIPNLCFEVDYSKSLVFWSFHFFQISEID